MFNNVPVSHSIDYGQTTLRLETGLLATQANATVVATMGKTTVMATVVVGNPSDRDYFPLQVIYEERLYAVGKIKGSRFIKREGRPTENAILTGRMVDRSIRSLFDKNIRSEIQVIITVLSLDEVNPPDTLSVIAASSALALATKDFKGPVSAVRIGSPKAVSQDTKSQLIQPVLDTKPENYNPDQIKAKLTKVSSKLNIKVPEDKALIAKILTHLNRLDPELIEDFKTIYKETTKDNDSGIAEVNEIAKLTVSPNYDQISQGELDLVISGDGENIVMLEAGANILPEDEISKALDESKTHLESLSKFQIDFLEKCKQKDLYNPIELYTKSSDPRAYEYWENFSTEIEEILYAKAPKQLKSNEFSEFKNTHLEINKKLLTTILKLESDNKDTNYSNLKKLTLEVLDKVQSQYDEIEKIIAPYILDKADSVDDLNNIIKALETELDSYIHVLMKTNILKKGLRFDNRALDETRKITSQAGVLDMVHGSSLFQRGETQVLNVLTIGTGQDAQLLDNMEDFEETTKRYIHHYNFPPYSVGETGRYSGPGRREIGHGALAEKALLPVLPNEEEFPYTMRLVSECLGSNGSTSMASTCSSCLSLMDGGVPIKDMVAGVAMGLVLDSETGKFEVLTDIQGIEDHYGDMDFKITGTEKGITAIQLDNKVSGLTIEILKEAIIRSKEARLHILNEMKKSLDKPRQEMSVNAPRVLTTDVPVNKIGDVIGPSGKIIKSIIADYDVEIEIDDITGKTFVYAKDMTKAKGALNKILSIIKVYEPGEVVTGEIFRIENYGAFIKIQDSEKEGMIHISQISEKRVEDINKVLKMGQKVTAKVLAINEKGQISLTLK